jgi:aryl-alcohol dehydrogenase-like predicted oxidoreductase
MQYVNLGPTGVKVSRICLGCMTYGSKKWRQWILEEEESRPFFRRAFEAGINFFDTADVYGGTKSEEFMGRVLKARRDEAVIATKFGNRIDDDHQGASPAYIRTAVEDSLRRLNTDRIDLYQLHRPDASVPIADTLAALGDLVEAGKVLEIGCSNFSLDQLREAEAAVGAGKPKFVSVQNDYSLLKRGADLDVLPECAASGLAFLPFYPLFSGLLTGKYRRNEPLPESGRLARATPERQATAFSERNYEIVENLTAFAEEHGHTILELAFARLLAIPAIPSVIAGATSAEQVQANAAAGGWQLGPEEIAEIDRLAPAE